MTTTPNLGIQLLDGDALNDWRDINAALEDVDGAAATPASVGAAISAHEGAADPHPTYLTAGEADTLFLTPAEGDAAYAALAHTHPSEQTGSWRFQDNPAMVNPGAGYMRSDTGNLATATVLALSRTTQDGYDIPPPGWGVAGGDGIYIQDRDDSTRFVRYTADEPLTQHASYATGAVTVVGSAGSIPHGTIVQVIFSLAGGGGGGAEAVTSVNGETGAVVLDAADVGALTQTAGDARYVQATGKAHNHTTADGFGVLTNEEHDGYSQYTNLGADAATPGTNTIRLYAKDNGAGVATLYYRTESGEIYELPTLTSGGGGGSGAPSNATYITTTAENKLSQERVLGSAVIMSGTLASRPAFGTAGRLYLATDDATAYRDTGSAWEVFARSQPKITVNVTAPSSPATGDLWVW